MAIGIKPPHLPGHMPHMHVPHHGEGAAVGEVLDNFEPENLKALKGRLARGHAVNPAAVEESVAGVRNAAMAEAQTAASQLSATDKVVGAVAQVAQIPMTIQQVAIPTFIAGSLIKKAGEKIKPGGMVEKTGHAIGAPVRFLTQSFNDMGSKLGIRKHIPKAIGEASVGWSALNVSFVGMSGLEMFGTARGFTENLYSLKQMYADMTGTDAGKISTLKVLMGSVPKPVAEARSHLLKSVGVEGIVETVGLIFGLKQLLGGNISNKAIALQMGLGMGAPALAGLMGKSILPFYKGFSDAHKHGKIPPEGYAAFISKINPRFEKMVEKMGADSPVVMAVATKFAQSNTAPGDILKLQAEGKLEKLGDEAVAEMKKASPAPAQDVPHHPPASMVDKLNAKSHPEKTKHRPLVGEFTGRLHSNPHEKGDAPPVRGLS